MIRKTFVARAAAVAAAAALLLPMASQAQNIAIVNGKAVPKARLSLLVDQAKKAGQQVTPELEAQAKDQVVLREILRKRPRSVASPPAPTTRRRWNWRARAS